MDKWLTKGGLTAIVKDVFMTPVNYSKLAFSAGIESNMTGLGTTLVFGGHLAALFAGAMVGNAVGPYIGDIAAKCVISGIAYFAFLNGIMGVVAVDTSDFEDSFPSITAHNEKPANTPNP